MVIKKSVYQKAVVAQLPVTFREAADVSDPNASEGSGAGGG